MIKTRYYKPKVIVDYDRIPYVYSAGNVRVTIDYNLSCSYKVDEFFNKDIIRIPIMEEYNNVLEVKYNDFIPDFIRYGLALNELERTSYSKYGNARLTINNYVGGCI